MINVLFVESNIDGTIGGSYFSLLFLLQGLDKSKYNPIVIFYTKNKLIEEFEKIGCQVVILNKVKPLDLAFVIQDIVTSNRYYRCFSYLSFFTPIIQKAINFYKVLIRPSFDCWKFLIKENIHLIHLNNTLLKPQEWILASYFAKCKVIAHERGINDRYPFLSYNLARGIKAHICISDVVKKNLSKNGFPIEKLHLVYNGIDPDSFIPSRGKNSLLSELGLSHRDQIVGLVGNLKQWKGQEVAIKAMRIVKKTLPNVKCLLIGGFSSNDYEYVEYINRLVKQYHLEDTVIFTGYQSDVPSYINILSILLHTSILPEPFGRVLIEGMVLSKPIITTSIGAGPEIVLDGDTGIIVRPEDPYELSQAIVFLLQNPHQMAQMGKAGRMRVNNFFHSKNTLRSVISIYSKVLD